MSLYRKHCLHLQACISLNAMYDKQRISGHPMPCEAEMRSYHLLTLMGTHGRYGYDGTEYASALAVSINSCLNQSHWKSCHLACC